MRTDVLSVAQRRYCMSRIRGRDTKPELRLRRQLWRLGLRYRLASKLPGKPDLVFASARVAVFVDGCQWHCCPVHWVRPKSNLKFWDRKFDRNRRRDDEVNRLLRAAGWTVIRLWEHEVLTNCDRAAARVSRIIKRRRVGPSVTKVL